MDDIAPLIARIESYGFECEAGPLKTCVDWIDLKKKIAELDEQADNSYWAAIEARI